MKRLDVSVLPGARRSYQYRFRPHARQPVRQRRANELRSVVAPDAGRRPATSDHTGHDPPNIGPRQRFLRVQHQALPGVFVHHGQPLEGTTVGRPVVNEVARPNVVLEAGRLLDTAVAAGARFGAEFSGFSQPQRPLQSPLVPEPSHPLEVDRPAPADQHRVNPPRAVTRVPPRQPLDLSGQCRFVVARPRAVS